MRAVYEQKLKTLPEVGLWRTRDGTLVGLVSMDAYRMRVDGRESIIIFTSSVVIDAASPWAESGPPHRAVSMTLRESFGGHGSPHIGSSIRSATRATCSCRTTSETSGRGETPTDTAGDVARLIDELARRRYGSDWIAGKRDRAALGAKAFPSSWSTAPIDDARRCADPDIAFFERANPGHREGDMLVCLAPLTARNLMGAVWRSATKRSRFR